MRRFLKAAEAPGPSPPKRARVEQGSEAPSTAQQHAFLDMGKFKDWDSVRKALASCPELINVQPLGRWSVLHHAAEAGKPDIVSFLLEQEASTTLKTKEGKTPLEVASTKAVRVLLKSADTAAASESSAGWLEAKHLKAYAPPPSSPQKVRKKILKRDVAGIQKKPRRRFRIVALGTKKEGLWLVKDPCNDKGVTVQKALSKALSKVGVSKPTVSSSYHGDGTWRSWKDAPGLWVDDLNELTDEMFTQIQEDYPDVAHIRAKNNRGRKKTYECKDVNIYNKKGAKGRHSDAQPYRNYCAVHTAGLACNASVWLDAHDVDYRTGHTYGGRGGRKVSLKIESGDCWIFEGKTPHCVHNCIPGTSPRELGKWLSDQRISILVRQKSG
jgi:hypothetical protein